MELGYSNGYDQQVETRSHQPWQYCLAVLPAQFQALMDFSFGQL
jgi:hypothetical protein